MTIRKVIHIEEEISNDPNYSPPPQNSSENNTEQPSEPPAPLPVVPRIRPQIPPAFKLRHLRQSAKNQRNVDREVGSSFDIQDVDNSEISHKSGRGLISVGRLLNQIPKSSQHIRSFHTLAYPMGIHPDNHGQPEASVQPIAKESPFVIDLPLVDPKVQEALKLPKDSEARKAAFIKLAYEYGQKKADLEKANRKSILEELRKQHLQFDFSIWHTPMGDKLMKEDAELQKRFSFFDASVAQLLLNEEKIEKREQEMRELEKKYPLYDHSLLRIVDSDESHLEENKESENSSNVHVVQGPFNLKEESVEESFVHKEDEQNTKDKQPMEPENHQDSQNRFSMYDTSIHPLLQDEKVNETPDSSSKTPISPALMRMVKGNEIGSSQNRKESEQV